MRSRQGRGNRGIELVSCNRGPLVPAELDLERNMGELSNGDCTQNLYGGRVELEASPDLWTCSTGHCGWKKSAPRN